MEEPCMRNCFQVVAKEPSFNLASKIVISVICLIAILLLALGGRALKHSSKLPCPFKTLCMTVVGSDMILAFITGLQPWVSHLLAYERELSTLGALMVVMTRTLVSIERAYALKCPLKYIACSENGRLTTLISVSTFVTVLLLYMFVRLLVCYMLRYTIEQEACTPYQFYFVTFSEVILILVTTICFSLVLHTIVKNKVQHTRRLTRMGLPTNHASSATDTHISAILFILYPSMLCLAITSLLVPFTVLIEDMVIPISISIAFRICFCCLHAVVFNAWFDEGRLHFLSILSSFSEYARDSAEEMRIAVYNIVISQAFEGSRGSLEGGGGKRRISRIRNTRSSRISSLRSATPKVSEQMIIVKAANLEKIMETQT